MKIPALFDHLSDLHVLVIGDVMLDTYCWGSVDRISPEAPVPVVSVKKTETRIGGAGNVAINTAALGASTSIISVIGKDSAGEQLLQLMKAVPIQVGHVVVTPERPTTNKTRIMSRNQQMLRLDQEETADLSIQAEELVWEQVQNYFSQQIPDVCILEDYNKGVLTSALIQKILVLCKENRVITTVDPKKKNFFAYQGVTLFKPNLKEVREGLNVTLTHIDLVTLDAIHQQLTERLHHQISFITLSEKGVYYNDGTRSSWLPGHIRNIADVSGAGDTVIAVASLVYAATSDMQTAAAIANIAGGLVCEEVGTAPIRKQLLLEETLRLLPV
ncbi:MAG: bifunctional heptose 7-phosphate kinase/heptose 1-phosphate adenyltransferase [Sediminibacterium sp.]